MTPNKQLQRTVTGNRAILLSAYGAGPRSVRSLNCGVRQHVMRISLNTFVLFLAACSLNSERARVAVPGTRLTLVLVEDEKHMTRYHFVADGQRVSGEGFLGPHQGDLETTPVVVVVQNHVRISWGRTSTPQYLVIDTTACVIIEHSNEAVPPPPVNGCNSHVVPAA